MIENNSVAMQFKKAAVVCAPQFYIRFMFDNCLLFNTFKLHHFFAAHMISIDDVITYYIGQWLRETSKPQKSKSNRFVVNDLFIEWIAIASIEPCGYFLFSYLTPFPMPLNPKYNSICSGKFLTWNFKETEMTKHHLLPPFIIHRKRIQNLHNERRNDGSPSQKENKITFVIRLWYILLFE